MKKERKAIFRIIGSIALIVLLIGTSILWGQLILKRMRSYIETNGKNNMATIMEQMSQSYDIQLNAYFCKLEQTERFLFQDGQREISLEEWKDFFDTAASENTEELLFMKNNGEVTTTDGRKTRLDIQSQMLIDLHQDQKIAQSVTLSSNGRNGNYFLIAIPCKTYTVNGENYHAIAALLDRTDIDTMLELNGYGGAAYIFLVDENGIVNYTNQPGENFYRNFALLKQLRKDKAISDGQYDALVEAVKSKQQRIELFDGNDAPFYLGCYPVANSNHSLICIVARSVVNNSLIAYQNTVIRLLAGYIGIVLLLCIALIYFSFRVRISSKKMAYEEEKRQIQEKAMKELEAAKNRADDANLSKEDIDRAVKEAEQFAAEDAKRKEEVDLRNNADQLLYQCDQAVKELGDKITPDELTKIDDAKKKLEEVLKGNDSDAIKNASAELGDIFQGISARVYQETGAAGAAGAAGAGAGAAGAGAAGGNANGGKDFYDADYEVVDDDQQ